MFTTVFCSEKTDTTDSQKNSSNSFYVANWNVENLFDTIDDPMKDDEWFSPDSEINWTSSRLEQKLENLAKKGRILNVKYVKIKQSAEADPRSRFKILELNTIVEAYRYNHNFKTEDI